MKISLLYDEFENSILAAQAKLMVDKVSPQRAGGTTRGRILWNVVGWSKHARISTRGVYFNRLTGERVTTCRVVALVNLRQQCSVHPAASQVRESSNWNHEKFHSGGNDLNRQTFIQVSGARPNERTRSACSWASFQHRTHFRFALRHNHRTGSPSLNSTSTGNTPIPISV